MKKSGRPKKIIQYPSINYSFILYDLKIKSKALIRLPSSSDEVIKQKYKRKVKVSPTKMASLINELGHQGTHDYLKKIGTHWISKEGLIFLEKNNV